jgi:putative flavoprotein involved in K+ transport
MAEVSFKRGADRMRESHDTIVIGGGQAGLIMSHHLSRIGREHVVLERRRVAERWRTERWDSLTFQFPNRLIRLPGLAFSGEPEAFASRDEILSFLERYAGHVGAPVRCGVEVQSLRREPGSERYQLVTPGGVLEARNVVIATGPYQRADLPPLAAGLPPRLLQLHASAYRNPEQLPSGAVLVVGSGASGCQIAEELAGANRTVYLSVSRHRRVPRRYRGRDLTDWLAALGMLAFTSPQWLHGQSALPVTLTGVGGGHDIDLRRFAADGVRLAGYLTDARGETVRFADNVESILRTADEAYHEFRAAVDAHLTATDGDAPPAGESVPAPPRPAHAPVRELDLRAAGVGSVIWSTGYQLDLGWVNLPVIDENGVPRHVESVTECPGVYFLGLPWLRTWSSTFLSGVGTDAEFLAEHIAAREGRGTRSWPS